MSRESSKTRTRILDTTWSLLEAGTSAVRMSDIARAVGISRQALYLHFPNRAELLVATTRHIDEVKHVDARLAESRAGNSGPERLNAFIEAWGNYIPEIFGVARALMALQDSDDEARRAWEDRMQAVRHGCAAAITAIVSDRRLRPEFSPERATDLLWTLLSVENWEKLTRQCGWSQAEYLASIKALAAGALLSDPA